MSENAPTGEDDTVDCAEPLKLAAWWATVLHTEPAQDFGAVSLSGPSPSCWDFSKYLSQGKLGTGSISTSIPRTGTRRWTDWWTWVPRWSGNTPPGH